MIASVCVSPKSYRVNRWRAKIVRVTVALALVALCTAVASAASESGPNSAEQRIPFKKSDEGIGGVLMRVAGSLILVTLIGAGAVYLFKRYFPSLYHPTFAGASRIKVIEIRRLTPKTTLFLIEIDGVHLLLGQHDDRLTTLYRRSNDAHDDDIAE